ncbi:MAG: hypothetical protein IMZ53_01475, partial [Thermoplasmata archaeon]|nr:hypothetical protein [Thermoplasmata archaeon]
MTKKKFYLSISGIIRGLKRWALKAMKLEKERLDKNEWKVTWVDNISDSPIGTVAWV